VCVHVPVRVRVYSQWFERQSNLYTSVGPWTHINEPRQGSNLHNTCENISRSPALAATIHRIPRAEKLRTSWSCRCGFQANSATRPTCLRCDARQPGRAQPPSQRSSTQQQRSQQTAATAAAVSSAPAASAKQTCNDPGLSSELKRLSDRIRFIQSWLAQQPGDVTLIALLSSSKPEFDVVKVQIEAA
jgi:hypothetical protein